MCGRLDQSHTAVDYVAALHWPHAPPLFSSAAAPSFNAPPGSYRPLLRMQDERLEIVDLHWGYRAAWAVGKVPVAINARVEKLSNRYWSPLMRRGRAILPADGWYEWTGEKGHKQPWHVHLKSGQPMFIAALAASGPIHEHAAEAGFVIVSADAQGGMVDINERRPVVLSAQDAALWLDPALTPGQAEQLARALALDAEAFDWHPVDKRVGRTGNDGPQLVVPITLAPSDAPPPQLF